MRLALVVALALTAQGRAQISAFISPISNPGLTLAETDQPVTSHGGVAP